MALGGAKRIQCVVLDFDGTFTDVHEEAKEFPVAYRADVCDIVGRDIGEEWAEAERTIAAHPDRFGWDVDGKLVAPANADPYIHSTAVATLVFKKLGILQSARLRSEIVQVLYKKAYEQTKTAFRPHAREVIDALMQTGASVTIVTNAHTDMVEKKLNDLGVPAERRPRIHGEARKFIAGALPAPDPVFDRLPETTKVAGLGRPVYVRRAHYYRALKRIWDEVPGAGPESTLVVGDIYELDLALPAELGASAHLMLRPGTNAWEREAVRALGPRGGQSDDLRAVLEWLT